MNTARFARWIAVLGLTYVLLACGGGGGGTSIAPTDSSPGGLWQGTITAGGATQQLFGLIAEDGRFHFFQEDGVQYFGTLGVTGNQLTASFSGAPFEGTTFADGSIKGTGTLSGTIQQRSKITISATFTTANSTVTNATATVSYSADYDVDSAVATISGNFTNAVTPGTDTLSITTAGVFSYNDAAVTGCMANGTISIIDARFNLYAVEFTYANPSCTGGLSTRNGVQFTGLATIDKTQNPSLMVLAVHGTVNGDPVALLLPYQST